MSYISLPAGRATTWPALLLMLSLALAACADDAAPAEDDGAELGASCFTNSECGGGLTCTLVDPLVGSICTRDCSSADAACGPGATCIRSPRGAWCAPASDLLNNGGNNGDDPVNNGDDNNGSEPSDVGGACEGDLDCQSGLRCYQQGDERFCVEVCDPAEPDCPDAQPCRRVQDDLGYCDFQASNNGGVNNGSTNNGATNNGGTNNGATNNGTTNNGTTNNGGCTSDAACGAGQICVDGGCLSGCRQDTACAEGQRCEPTTHQCVPDPAWCAADALEPNDAAASARTLAPGAHDATACTDEDWYTIATAAGDTVTAALAFTHADGDLSLTLFAADGTTELASSSTSANSERVVHVSAGGALLLRVTTARLEGGSSYRLTLTVEPRVDDPCDDRFEPNDTIDAAATIPEGSHTGLGVCPTDTEDWFAIDLGPLDTVRVDLAFRNADSDIDLRLVDADRTSTLDSSASVSDAESVEAQVDAAGTYYFRVYNFSGRSARYDMTVSVVPGPEPPACDEDAFEPNDSVPLASPLTTTVSGAVACATDDDWYAVQIDDPSTELSVVLNLGDRFGTVRAAIVAADATTTLASTTSATATTTLAQPGTVYVRATLEEGEATRYGLSITTRIVPNCNDAWEPNNTISQAAMLAPGNYRGMALCPTSDTSDYYLISARAGTQITATARFQDSIADLDMSLIGTNGTTILDSSTSTTDDEDVAVTAPADGYYYLRVYHYSGSANSYELTLDSVPLDLTCEESDLEDNDTVADAIRVAPGSHAGTICPFDGDVYAVQASPGQQIFATLRYTHAAGDLLLEQLAADGTVLVTSSSADDDEAIPINARDEGLSWLRVRGAGAASNTYTLDVEVRDVPVSYVCFDAFEVNDSRAQAWPVGPGEYRDLDMCRDEDTHDWYAIELRAGQRITVDILFLDANADLDLELLGTNGTTSLARSTSTSDNEQVTATASVDGIHYIHAYVYSNSGDNTYSMNIQVQ